MSAPLYNHTLLRGYLARLQANIRELAALYFERMAHPANKDGSAMSPTAENMRKEWDKLSADLVIVIGPEAALKPFNQLADPGSFSQMTQISSMDPFRITMKALKLLADKARRTHPEVTLLKSWDVEARECPKDRDGMYLYPEETQV